MTDMNDNSKIRIAFVGAGNVAWHLAQALAAAGFAVAAVYSRSAESREALAQKLNAQAFPAPDFTAANIDVVIVAVPDAALAQVAQTLKVAPGTVVAHTSGSQPLAVLDAVPHALPAVFYPLQTFSKAKPIAFAEVPILIEARQTDTIQQLERLAQSLSQQVLQVNPEARQQLHLAAVFACNFTNHLLGISQLLLQEANLPVALLQPLISETIAKAAAQNPFLVQTGPAVRRDENVIQAHLQKLLAHPQYRELYQKLTESIQATSI